MKTPEQIAQLGKIVADYQIRIMELEAADRAGEVLMWEENGLCVILRNTDQCGIGNALTATNVINWKALPEVRNGHGQLAKRVTRGAAIDYAIAELKRLTIWIEEMEA